MKKVFIILASCLMVSAQPLLEKSSSLLKGLVFAYHLEEPAGTRYDASGRGNNLSDSGSTWINAGVCNASQYFTNTYLYASSSADFNIGTNDAEIVCWVMAEKLPAAGSAATFLSKWDGNGSNPKSYLAWLDNTGGTVRFKFAARNTGDTSTVIATASSFGTPATNTWYCINLVHTNGVGIGIGVNGGTIDGAALTTGVRSTTNNFEIGRDLFFQWRGRIDETYKWSRLLTSSERSLVARQGSSYPRFTPCTQPTLWRLQSLANGALNGNVKQFTSGASVIYYAAGANSVYAQECWIVDSWLATLARQTLIPVQTLTNILDRFYSTRSGNGVSESIQANGTASFYSCITSPDRAQTDGLWSLIGLHKNYYDRTGLTNWFSSQSAFLRSAMLAVPRSNSYVNVGTWTNGWQTWGYEDGTLKYGHDLFGTLGQYYSDNALSQLYTAVGDSVNASVFSSDAASIYTAITNTSGPLWDAGNGMFLAASITNNQVDVIGSSFAVWLGACSPSQASSISDFLYSNYSSLVNAQGFIRQSPTNWSPATQCGWSSGNYDDGYWSYGHLWVLTALAVNHPTKAGELAKTYANNTYGSQEWISTGAFGLQQFMNSAHGVYGWSLTNQTLIAQ